MSDKVNILGVKIDKVSIDEAVEKIIAFTNEDKVHTVFTPNSEIIMSAYRDDSIKEILNNASLLTADGIGVVKAAQIVKNPVKERCAGYDISIRLMSKMEKENKSLYLFGSKPEIVKTAYEKIKEKHPLLNIAGYSDGYFDEEKEIEIIDDINEKKPDVVFVCLGCPKQEKWINTNKDKLSCKVLMGLGGCLDVYAGYVKRAPDIFIKLNLEWFYRLIKEPKRFVRMLDLPRFAMKVIAHGRKFPQD